MAENRDEALLRGDQEEQPLSSRSAREKEKTKLRERQRRSVTTKIIQGLRRHGGYRLSPRADINQVLRELAREAGWIVDPDGTTYRSKVLITHCPLCGATRNSGAPTPTSSITGGHGGGGDCSTTASPRRLPVGESSFASVYPASAYRGGERGGGTSVSSGLSGYGGTGAGGSSSLDLITSDDRMAVYALPASGFCPPPATSETCVDAPAMAEPYQRQQQ